MSKVKFYIPSKDKTGKDINVNLDYILSKITVLTGGVTVYQARGGE